MSSEHSSGCADGKTDGLADYEAVQACSGRWKGHVKRARTLCAAGWQVCSPRHSSALTLVTWTDVTRLPGCYAYNAANTLNLCSVYATYSLFASKLINKLECGPVPNVMVALPNCQI